MSVTPIRRAARTHDAPGEAVAPSAPIPFGPRSVRDSDRPAPRHEGREQRALGQLLLDDGAVDPGNLLKALVMQRRETARLGEILLAHGWVTEAALARALTRLAAPVDPGGDERRVLDGVAHLLHRRHQVEAVGVAPQQPVQRHRLEPGEPGALVVAEFGGDRIRSRRRGDRTTVARPRGAPAPPRSSSGSEARGRGRTIWRKPKPLTAVRRYLSPRIHPSY